ncbi:MAG: indolepyruvate ferredoxin oxidoreductase subunit alpha [Eggerthellaceae bacterium]|jgi:NAD-dependent dihydropyrimidine dehydrogenase PreA subunit
MDLGMYLNINRDEQDFKPRKGGGLRDFIKDKTSAKAGDDAFVQWFFKTIIASAPLTHYPATEFLLKNMARLGGPYNTKGISVPLHNVRMPDEEQDGASDNPLPSEDGEPVGKHAKKTTIEVNQTLYSNVHKMNPPIEMMKDTVARSSYRAIMHECVCRKIQGCKDYPLDLGCLFIGPAARSCVERGIAREATAEECFEHIDRAKEAGLSAIGYFVEVEEFCWDFKDKDMPNFLEFCFCCPCCCSAVRFEQGATGPLQRVLHQGMGFSCVVDTDVCCGCGLCEQTCPHDVIHVVNRKATVDPTCAGCGQCTLACNYHALTIQQTGSTKPHIEDYFEKLHATL